MNNTKYYTNNLAYDFEMFLPKEKRQEDPSIKKAPDNIINMPGMSGKAGAVRRKKEAARSRSFAVVTTLLILAMICSTIFLRVQVTEVETQITAAKKELSGLDSQETALQMELEKKISFTNIEQAAESLGMQKKDRTQVKYIQTSGTSWAEVLGDQNTLADKD